MDGTCPVSETLYSVRNNKTMGKIQKLRVSKEDIKLMAFNKHYAIQTSWLVEVAAVPRILTQM
jgi:translation initiation factor IF-2